MTDGATVIDTGNRQEIPPYITKLVLPISRVDYYACGHALGRVYVGWAGLGWAGLGCGPIQAQNSLPSDSDG